MLFDIEESKKPAALLNSSGVESSWRPPELSRLPSWRGAKRVGFDIETRDDHLKKLGPGPRRGAYIVGFSFCIEGDRPYYVPIRHEGGDNVPAVAALDYLRDQAKVFTGELIGANLSYDLDFVHYQNVTWNPAVKFRDIQNAEPLLDENQFSYSLENIAQRHDLGWKNETELRAAAESFGVDPKGGLWKLPARFVGEYAEHDALLPILVYQKQWDALVAENLTDIFELETRVLPCLLRMRWRGVQIDEDHLDRVENHALDIETCMLREVHRHSGVTVAVGDVWKAAVLAPAIEAVGITLPKTSEGRPSITKEWMSSIDHPVAKCVAEARVANKIRTTFVASIRRYMTNGRLHCVFNQLKREKDNGRGLGGTVSGRLSSSSPNLQQVPVRTAIGNMVRECYIPEPGTLWDISDFSQQEPRMITHFAEMLHRSFVRNGKRSNLGSVIAMAEAYRNDPTTDNHSMMAELTGLKRKDAKTIYLGLCYGMGGGKLARSLGLPVVEKEIANRVREYAGPEAQAILDQFNDRAGYVRALAKHVEEIAGQKGFVRTILGRHGHFPKGKNGKYDWVYKALNKLIQGSSADQTKRAMVEVDEAGYYVQLQVHDEIDLSIESPKQAREVERILVEAVPLTVPNKVDVELGRNWGSCVDISEFKP